MSEEYGNDFITLTDEDGNEVELEHLDTLEYEGETYMAFVAANETPEEVLDEESAELIILKVETEADGEEMLVTLEDDDLLETIFDLFVERLEARTARKPAKRPISATTRRRLRRRRPRRVRLEFSALRLCRQAESRCRPAADRRADSDLFFTSPCVVRDLFVFNPQNDEKGFRVLSRFAGLPPAFCGRKLEAVKRETGCPPGQYVQVIFGRHGLIAGDKASSPSPLRRAALLPARNCSHGESGGGEPETGGRFAAGRF